MMEIFFFISGWVMLITLAAIIAVALWMLRDK